MMRRGGVSWQRQEAFRRRVQHVQPAPPAYREKRLYVPVVARPCSTSHECSARARKGRRCSNEERQGRRTVAAPEYMLLFGRAARRAVKVAGARR